MTDLTSQQALNIIGKTAITGNVELLRVLGNLYAHLHACEQVDSLNDGIVSCDLDELPAMMDKRDKWVEARALTRLKTKDQALLSDTGISGF